MPLICLSVVNVVCFKFKTTFNLKVRNPGTVEKMIANSDELTDGTEGVDGTDG